MITLGCNIGKLTIYFSSLIYLGRITAGFSVLTGGICYIVIVVMVILRLAPCLDSLIDYQLSKLLLIHIFFLKLAMHLCCLVD
jgi:hypothetical protein